MTSVNASRSTLARRVLGLTIVAVGAVVMIPAPAAAYIDPVSGSVLIQVVSAALFAGLLTFRRWARWIASLFDSLKRRRVQGTGRKG